MSVDAGMAMNVAEKAGRAALGVREQMSPLVTRFGLNWAQDNLEVVYFSQSHVFNTQEENAVPT